LTTEGPRGETPVPSSFIAVSENETATIRDDSLTLAIALHDTSSEFSKVLIQSIQAEAQKLNVSIVFISSAEFMFELQRTQYQTLETLNPDLLITLALSTTETSQELKRLAQNGTSISFLSNLPDSIKYPEEYASVITDDLFGMGRSMAELITSISGDSIQLLYVYHEDEYYVTNQRDQSFINVLKLVYPNVTIVDSIGISSPKDLREKLIPVLVQSSSEIDVVYTPWATVAEETLPLLKEIEYDIDLYTIDLSSTLFQEMLYGDIVKGFVSDLPQELGRSLLISVILHHYNLETPAFSIVPAIKVNKENGEAQWEMIMNTPQSGDHNE